MLTEKVTRVQLDLTAIRSGLIIQGRWLDLILSGQKTWEMRSQRNHKREWIGLIRARSKTVVGVCRVVGEHGPLSLDQMKASYEKHRIPLEEIQAIYEGRWRMAWELKGVYKLKRPIRHEHRSGAQQWVTLDDRVRALVASAQVQRVTAHRTNEE